MNLVFATQNPNKLKEVRLLLPTKFRLLSLEDIGCKEDIPETAATLEGNAMIKANYVYSNYGYPCFADDTGLLVDALDGEPGVHSARYAGDHKSAQDNIDKLLQRLQPHKNRHARFITVIALKNDTEMRLFKGEVAGHIIHEKRGHGGFGYDPVFVPEGFKETFAEMPTELKNEMSHRGLALQNLVTYLNTVESN